MVAARSSCVSRGNAAEMSGKAPRAGDGALEAVIGECGDQLVERVGEDEAVIRCAGRVGERAAHQEEDREKGDLRDLAGHVTHPRGEEPWEARGQGRTEGANSG